MIPVANLFFSGAGLLDYGVRKGGVKIGQSFEIDPTCCATQRANFDHEVVECDITKKLVAAEKGCDVRLFTYPCNTYSAIADIHGTRTGDALYLHALRHLVINPPELFSAENVPGMKKFPLVMEVLTKLPDYYVTVFCPVSTQLWLPQVRDRLIIIGSRRNFAWRLPKATRRVKLREILERDPDIQIPDYVYKRLRGHYRDLPIVSDPKKDDLAPTCVAHYSKDLSTRLVVDKRFRRGVRPYTVREYARLQGLPDSFKFTGSNSQSYRMIGNGVSIPTGEWLGREICRYFKRWSS